MEIKSVFVDANIFIDFGDEKRDTKQISFQILNYLLKNKITIYTSCDLITTIYYILSKNDKQIALNTIEYINKMVTIIDFSNKELLQIINLMREDNNFKDLEDTIQYVLAKNTSCDLIISNDKGFYSPDIELVSGDVFVEKLEI